METQLSKDRSFVMIAVTESFDSGHISSTGNSFVYRVYGKFVKSNGSIGGKDGERSHRRNVKLPFKSKYASSFISKNEVVKHDFDGIIYNAVKIKKG